ncbi:hypothetical protein QFC19_008266 [Naganishia cerealis]|uniref:Uncharacterized protein n=1 Tax=Naganishia cerealis TaxID=610337 RepID=A0ACC2V3P4_9TREE|nr:hypothetical protein QFC19_008266 [Naganishia cerealis]
MSEQEYYIGFDVGTGSARAALLDSRGRILADSMENTITYRDESDHRIFEQSTANIWSCLAKCCKSVLSQSGVSPEAIKGVSFDATCSLAVVDRDGKTISVTKGQGLGKEGDRNVILWADHRAEKEAEEINQTGEGVLNFVGGAMSLEMEIPKTLWLKRHMSVQDFEAVHLFDPSDEAECPSLAVTYRATGSSARSNCSLTCKFSYVPPGTDMAANTVTGKVETSKGWSESFLTRIGLESLVKRNYEQIGGSPGENGLILTAGQPVGNGLTASAASEFGLKEGTPVGSAVIDAYAGWIGTIAASHDHETETEKAPSLADSSSRLAAVAGTSTCHLVQSDHGILVNGVWGPYRHAVFPDYWMNEGGQSSTGQLIDFIMQTHPAYNKVLDMAKQRSSNVFDILEEKLEELKKDRGCGSSTELTKNLHLYPDLHGLSIVHHSPFLLLMLHDPGVGDLAMKFHVTLEAIALQTRHILDEMHAKGHRINAIYMSGSQAKNKPLMELLASVCNVKVIIPPNPSAAVVAGSAMLGRYAHEVAQERNGKPILTQVEQEESAKKSREALWRIMVWNFVGKLFPQRIATKMSCRIIQVEMTPEGKAVLPAATDYEQRLLDVKYKIFRESIDVQRKWRTMVEDVAK